MRESKMKRQERVRPAPGRVPRPGRCSRGIAKRKVKEQPGRASERWRARTRAAAHLVEDPMGKEVDLGSNGVHLDVLREEADEWAAVQRVDEPSSLRQLGHRVLAQRHVETCVHDRTRAGQVSGVCGAGAAAGLARAAAQHAGFTQRLRGRAARPPFSAVVDPPKVASAACQPGRRSVAAVAAAVSASSWPDDEAAFPLSCCCS